MDVADVVLEQLASSEAVLTDDEKEIGVVLIDCGGGTTDIAIFIGGSIRYTENVTLGGDNIDRDIALGLSTSPCRSEEDKGEIRDGHRRHGFSGRDDRGAERRRQALQEDIA